MPPSTNDETPRWDAEQVLEIINPETQTWSCLAATAQGRRCRRPLGQTKSKAAAELCPKIGPEPPAAPEVEARHLRELAPNCLCHSHIDQDTVDELVRCFTSLLEKGRRSLGRSDEEKDPGWDKTDEEKIQNELRSKTSPSPAPMSSLLSPSVVAETPNSAAFNRTIDLNFSSTLSEERSKNPPTGQGQQFVFSSAESISVRRFDPSSHKSVDEQQRPSVSQDSTLDTGASFTDEASVQKGATGKDIREQFDNLEITSSEISKWMTKDQDRKSGSVFQGAGKQGLVNGSPSGGGNRHSGSSPHSSFFEEPAK